MANTTASASGRNRIAGDAAQAEHRHEHDADAEQRDEGRHHDLRAPSMIAASTSLPISRW
jgi:hypothetical protein